MNNKGNLGLVTGMLLVGFLLIGAVSASVIMKSTTTSTSDKNLNQITNEVVDEITTYIQIKDVVGKYQTIQDEQRIQQIAILIKPLVTLDIDITHMMIKISNGEQIYILYYNGNGNTYGSSSLFSHPAWSTLTENTFTIITLIDDDQSIIASHVMNKNTDTAFLLLKLPLGITMRNGDAIQITLIPTPGMQRTVTIEAPLPTSHVVTLYE
jgi:archaellin